MFSRRRFMKSGAGALALLAMRRRAYGFAQSPGLTKFRADWPLQGLGNSGIPVMTSDRTISYPGGIVAQKNTPVQVTFQNYLPAGPHPVGNAIDQSGYLMDASMYPNNRASVH